ncbi:MAG TPA: WXG100 family type VII secretion target [Pseudonocardiaceae bacterium]|jgi:WXG100 family type VII secretion target|nr:WXG100 family type VII secretion target [Pseudonocardiaceae bacterium]
MAGSFSTGSAELQKAGQQMEQTNQEMMSNLQKLSGECEQIRSTWKGAAATAFTNLMQRFETDSKNLNQSLDQIAQAIGANAQNYAQQEQEAQSSITSIMNTLGGA